jgi:hypothetical protein
MPTRPGFVPNPNRKHEALVVMNPAGGTTFGVECTACYWSPLVDFATQQEARCCQSMLHHIEVANRLRASRESADRPDPARLAGAGEWE